MKNPYHSESGTPWLRQSWVVYLDILGFSEGVRASVASGGQEDHLERLLAALKEAKEIIYSGHEFAEKYGDGYAPYMVKVFTDNIVVGYPVLEDGESEFGRMVYAVGLYQYALLNHGFFVRGGVGFGELYMDEDVVYGSGIIEAYEAESKLARDPRVVFAKSAADLMLSHLTYYDKVETAPQNRHVLVDSDSQLFINYLVIPTVDYEELPADFLNSLAHQRDLIAARLEEFADVPQIWSKYEWAALYHNFIVNEYYELSTDYQLPEHLLVPKPRSLGEVYELRRRTLYKGSEKVAEFKSMFEYPPQVRPE